MNKNEILALCTEMNLPAEQANILVACVQVESGFNQYAIHLNNDANGNVLSIDYGICQVNDCWHIGSGKDFPNPEYVLSNPSACITWMIKMFLAGKQSLWSSYTSGAYKKFLPS